MVTPNFNDVRVDIALIQGDDKIYDVEIGEDGDLVPVYSFNTSLIMDLLSDKRADINEVVFAARRRGWIGNESNEVPGFEFGSKLWLLYQSRLDTNTKNAIVDAASDALSWYVPQFAQEIDVSAKITPDGIILTITIKRKFGKVDKLYFRLWELTGV